MGDIDTAAVDSLKTLDPKRPIREATEQRTQFYVGFVPIRDSCAAADVAQQRRCEKNAAQGRRHWLPASPA